VLSKGSYLPSSVTTPIVLGAFIGWAYDKWVCRASNKARDNAKRMGILMASGLIVGESLFNVALAGLIVGTNKGEPLALVGDAFQHWGVLLGLFGSIAIVVGLYLFSALVAKPDAVEQA
jgi:hypothetical protein